jgi:hypothetical protein
LPGQHFGVELFQVSSLAFTGCEDIAAVRIAADVVVYIDDGLPAELRNYDLMADLQPIMKSGWRVPEADGAF